METNESVLRKIRALLTKTEGQGCTPEEAASAAEKAKQLLDEHNLSLHELNPNEFNSSIENKDIELDYDRIPAWMKYLANYIALGFDCKCICYPGRKISFYGLKSDIETTVYFFVRLTVDFRVEAEKQYDQFKHSASIGSNKRVWANNFIISAGKAVYYRLKRLKVKPTTSALIVVKEQLIDKFIKNTGVVTRMQASNAQHDRSAEDAGTKYGQNVELNKKITNEHDS